MGERRRDQAGDEPAADTRSPGEAGSPADPTAVALASTFAARGHAHLKDGRNLMIGPSLMSVG